VPIAPRYRGNRELLHKKSIPFHGRFVPELCERNGLYMKKIINLLALSLIVCVIAVCLTGCSVAFDASAYIKGNLDSLYLGTVDAEFLDLVSNTEEELKQSHEAALLIETEYFFNFFDIVEDLISPEMKGEVIEMYRLIYSNAKYEVGEATQTGDDYLVDVTVYPIDIIQKVLEDFDDFMSAWYDRQENGSFEDLSVEEFETLWAREVINFVKARIGSIGYLEPETLSVRVVSHASEGSNFYTISDDDIRRVDTLIITY